MKPTIGRIVIYNYPGSNSRSMDPAKHPALIQKVHDEGTVDLWVFGENSIYKEWNVKQGDQPSQWDWPPRV